MPPCVACEWKAAPRTPDLLVRLSWRSSPCLQALCLSLSLPLCRRMRPEALIMTKTSRFLKRKGLAYSTWACGKGTGPSHHRVLRKQTQTSTFAKNSKPFMLLLYSQTHLFSSADNALFWHMSSLVLSFTIWNDNMKHYQSAANPISAIKQQRLFHL